MRRFVRLILGGLLFAVPCATCWADGGAIRAIVRDGPVQISVFTSPHPLVAGPADISVLVQDAETLAPLPEAQIEVALTPRGRAYAALALAATSAAATNKLFRACLVELEPGWYDVDVTCASAQARGAAHFAVEVGPAPPQLAALWPWFTWPALPIALFAFHAYLSRQKRR